MLNMRITINRNLQAKTPKKKRLTDWICTHGTDPRARPTLAGPSQPEKQEKRSHTWLFLLLIEITSWRLFTFLGAVGQMRPHKIVREAAKRGCERLTQLSDFDQPHKDATRCKMLKMHAWANQSNDKKHEKPWLHNLHLISDAHFWKLSRPCPKAQYKESAVRNVKKYTTHRTCTICVPQTNLNTRS